MVTAFQEKRSGRNLPQSLYIYKHEESTVYLYTTYTSIGERKWIIAS